MKERQRVTMFFLTKMYDNVVDYEIMLENVAMMLLFFFI